MITIIITTIMLSSSSFSSTSSSYIIVIINIAGAERDTEPSVAWNGVGLLPWPPCSPLGYCVQEKPVVISLLHDNEGKEQGVCAGLHYNLLFTLLLFAACTTWGVSERKRRLSAARRNAWARGMLYRDSVSLTPLIQVFRGRPLALRPLNLVLHAR